MRILCTLILPTSGRARVCNHDLSEEEAIRSHIGLAAGEERSFYWRLSGRENLRFYGVLQGLTPAQITTRLVELEKTLDLEEALAKRFDRLSTGMRRRLDLARALLHRPDVLFLDEPTRSLDPLAAAALHEQIRLLARAGQTIFLVTHQPDEARRLCERVAILHQGRLRAVAPISRLQELVRPQRRYRLTLAQEIETSPWEGWPWPTQVLPAPISGQTLLEVGLPDGEALGAVLRDLLQAGLEPIEVAPQEVPLEEVLEHLTHAEAAPAPAEERPAVVAGPPPPATALVAPGEPAVEAPRRPAAASADTAGRGEQPARPATIAPWPALLHFLRRIAAFFRRDLLTLASYRLATLLQVGGVLVSVALFYFMAQLFGAAVLPTLRQYGGDYFAFVLLGIAFAGYQTAGLSSFAQAIRSGQVLGTLEAMLATPTRLGTILLASSLGTFLGASVQVLLYLLIGGLFGATFPQGNVGTALLALLLSILAFSGLGILSAGFILVTKRGDPLQMLLNTASFLLAGVYYPLEVLPAWLQRIALLLPMTHALRAMRLALLQGAGPAQVAPELLTLGLLASILLPGSMLAFRLALRRARTEGSLTQF